MNCLRWSRFLLHLFATVAFLVGIILLVVALVGTKWRVSYLDQLVNEDNIHAHGLWRDCEYDDQSKRLICTISKNEKEEKEHHPHYIEGFERSTIYMLAFAIVFGFLGVLLGFVTSCADLLKYRPALRYCGIVWVILHVASAILATAAAVAFAYHNSKPENIYSFITKNVQNVLGRDYYICAYAAGVLMVSAILAIVCVVLMFVLSHGTYVYVKVPRERAIELGHKTSVV